MFRFRSGFRPGRFRIVKGDHKGSPLQFNVYGITLSGDHRIYVSAAGQFRR